MTAQRWRTVEVVVDRAGGDSDRGVGCLVADGVVLTAADVVRHAASIGAISVGLTGPDGERRVVRVVDLVDDREGRSQIAVLDIPVTSSRDMIDSARFARLPVGEADVAAEIHGFPRLLVTGGLRATGADPGIGRGRRHEIIVDDRLSSARGDAVYWASLSGAPVWVSGNIVGFVAEPGSDAVGGRRRVVVRPVDAVYDIPMHFVRESIIRRLGLPNRATDLTQVGSIHLGDEHVEDQAGHLLDEVDEATPFVRYFLVSPSRRREALWEGRTVTIGRAAANMIVLSDRLVSARHCTLTVDRDGVDGRVQVWLADHSQNGTWVNGGRMPRHGRRALAEGDVIAVGDGETFELRPVARPVTGPIELGRTPGGVSAGAAAAVPFPPKLFISYAREDEGFRERLVDEMTVLRRQGLIQVWHDRRIVPGAGWQREIDDALEGADVVLALVSSRFLNSENCGREMEKAFALQREGQLRVIPVILRTCLWQHERRFRELQVLPKDGRPISSYSDPDEAYVEVIDGLLRVIGRSSDEQRSGYD